MKNFVLALFFGFPVAVAALEAPAGPVTPPDERELAALPSPARLAYRAEMRARMVALDRVIQLMTDGKAKEAGAVAQRQLGLALHGERRKLPQEAQPVRYMPVGMARLDLVALKSAEDFATVALTGDERTAAALLPLLTGACANCHSQYRIR